MNRQFTGCAIVAALFLMLSSCSGDKKDNRPAGSQILQDSIAEITYTPKSLPGEPDIDSVLSLDESPMPLKSVNPSYPKDALDKRVEGMVWVKILIDKSGNVKRSAVIKRKGTESFEKAALDAIGQWKFKPGRVKNQAVDVWVVVPFRFKTTSYIENGPAEK
jgi:protein TonB